MVKAGAPSIGTDPNDSHIWYYNGTPSACVQIALDYIFPTFTNITSGTPDLVLSGPNYATTSATSPTPVPAPSVPPISPLEEEPLLLLIVLIIAMVLGFLIIRLMLRRRWG
jgi:hypothetical protein